jgi:DNA polymerase
MIEVTLDFETHWGHEYSLSNMTTTEYIYSDLFEIQGVGIAIGDNDPIWHPGPEQAAAALQAIDWSNVALIGHNLNFDGSILAFRFGLYPQAYYDTASMARVVMPFLKYHSLKACAAFFGLEEKVVTALINVKDKRFDQLSDTAIDALGEYCKMDVKLTRQIYTRMKRAISADELKLMDVTTRMMTQPTLQLNPDKLQALIDDKLETRQQLIKEAGVELRVLRSTQQMTTILENLGIEVPKKPSPSNPDELIPTFQRNLPEVVALTRHPNKRVRDLIKARLEVMSSIDLNRAKRMLAVYNASGGDFPIPLKHAGAHTLRWSGTDKLNAQNFTKGPIREAIIAPPHHKVVVADLGQIEARLTAWLAEHLKLLAEFANPDGDVYKDMATEIFDKPFDEIDYSERFIGKVLILSAGFGIGWKKLLLMFQTSKPELGITEHQAAEMVEKYRMKNFPIVRLWDRLQNYLIKMLSMDDGEEFTYKCLTFGKGYVKLPSGNALYYPELRYEIEEDDWGNERPQLTYTHKGNPTRIYGGRFTENIIQALARCVIAEHILKISERYKVAGMAHDEIICVAHNSQAQDCLDYMCEVMRTPPSWAPDLPLDVKGAIADSYGDAK